jgi:ABC-type sugar transport system ATPase subunit
MAMCTRVIVLRDGRVGAELGADGLTEHALVSAMEGEDDADGERDERA